MPEIENAPLRTRTQRLALAAFDEISKLDVTAEFRSFALSFPTLVHTCGLCQAVAYANTKRVRGKEIGQLYLAILAKTLLEIGHAAATDRSSLCRAIQSMSVNDYIRISRDSLIATNFIKRYVEATYVELSKESDQ